MKRFVTDFSWNKVMLQDVLSKILRPSRKRIVVCYLRRTYLISERAG
ncbi:MAG: hypothetical protein OJF50_005397 [Nitrospira sp.]|nr:hypothetical protein [Nitrospira sp.]